MNDYPKRDASHFSRFTRAVFASEVPKRFGTDVTALVLFIASEEFRLFQAVPPSYWFNGMKLALGFGGNDRLLKAIRAAQASGLLHYDSESKPSLYWTLIPTWLEPFYDGEHSQNRNRKGVEHSRNRSRTGNGTGKHSINIEEEVEEARVSLSVSSEAKAKQPILDWPMPEGVNPDHWRDWLTHRKAKRASNTPSAWSRIEREAAKAGLAIPAVVQICAERPWIGIAASWVASSVPLSSSEYKPFVPSTTEDPIKPKKISK